MRPPIAPEAGPPRHRPPAIIPIAECAIMKGPPL
jgi:hypothetical protein